MYTISYPSGTIRKDGVIIEQRDDLPECQAYIAWLKQGNGPSVLQDEPIYPRIEVSAWKLVQALHAFGWLEQVDAAVEASTDPLVKYGWRRAPTFYSDQPLTLALATAIGKTRAELQSLFELAESFKA